MKAFTSLLAAQGALGKLSQRDTSLLAANAWRRVVQVFLVLTMLQISNVVHIEAGLVL